MNQGATAALMRNVANVVRDYAAAAIAPLSASIADHAKRLEALTERPAGDPEAIEHLRQTVARITEDAERRETAAEEREMVLMERIAGLEAHLGEHAAEAAQREESTLASMRGAMHDLKGEIPALIDEKVAAIPAPKDGEPGRDGKDADLNEVRTLIVEQVRAAVADIPAPRDGKDADPVEIERMVTEAVAKLPTPLHVTGGFVDRAGSLILTKTDGSTQDLGPVVGKDGEPGPPGRDGQNGRDGFGFEDMSEEIAEDDRTIIRRYVRGDEVKEFRHTFPVVIDRGIYKAGAEYEPGDGVTYAGSFFIAQERTKDKPETNSWRLAIKRGRDGKDGTPGPKGEKGDPGRNGRDGTGW